MRKIIPALVLVMLAYLVPLPPAGDCPAHGPSCVHGSSCPTAQRELAEKAAASCHTSAGVEKAEAKKHRCAITACHAESSRWASGLDASFIVDFSSYAAAVVPEAFAPGQARPDEDLHFEDISEPPERRLLS